MPPIGYMDWIGFGSAFRSSLWIGLDCVTELMDWIGCWKLDPRPNLRSHDVVGHMTNRFAICHFLLVSHWKRVSIFNRFRDICIQIYLGHDLDLSGSRVDGVVTGPMILIPHVLFPIGAPWFSSETLALYKSLTYLLTYL